MRDYYRKTWRNNQGLSESGILALVEFCRANLRSGFEAEKYALELECNQENWGDVVTFNLDGFHTINGGEAAITFDKPQDFFYFTIYA